MGERGALILGLKGFLVMRADCVQRPRLGREASIMPEMHIDVRKTP